MTDNTERALERRARGGDYEAASKLAFLRGKLAPERTGKHRPRGCRHPPTRSWGMVMHYLGNAIQISFSSCALCVAMQIKAEIPHRAAKTMDVHLRDVFQSRMGRERELQMMVEHIVRDLLLDQMQQGLSALWAGVSLDSIC